MTAGVPLAPDKVRAILTRLRAGDPQHKVAAELGLSRHTIHRYARMHGVGRVSPRRDLPVAFAPSGDLTWLGKGNCRHWPDIAEWPDQAETTKAKKAAVGRAIDICHGISPDKDVPLPKGACPVLERCREWGLEVPCLHSDDRAVFGGMPPEVRLRRQREMRETAS